MSNVDLFLREFLSVGEETANTPTLPVGLTALSRVSFSLCLLVPKIPARTYDIR